MLNFSIDFSLRISMKISKSLLKQKLTEKQCLIEPDQNGVFHLKNFSKNAIFSDLRFIIKIFTVF